MKGKIYNPELIFTSLNLLVKNLGQLGQWDKSKTTP